MGKVEGEEELFKWAQELSEEVHSPITKKHKKNNERGSNKQDQLLYAMARMSLRTQQECRFLIAGVFHCVKIESNSSVIAAMQTALGRFMDQTKGKAGHAMGTPDVWVFTAMLLAIKPAAADTRYATICQFCKQYPPNSDKLPQIVAGCRYQKCYDKKYMKIFFRLRSACSDGKLIDDIVQVTWELLIQKGGVPLYGQAPKGSQERQVQELLNELDPRHRDDLFESMRATERERVAGGPTGHAFAEDSMGYSHHGTR